MLSPGEHLLLVMAPRLFPAAPAVPPGARLRWAAPGPGPLTAAAFGLGGVIAALRAWGALSLLSPVPDQFAAVCARLNLGGHGITAPPAGDLPEPWLSMLVHNHRGTTGAAPPATAAPP